MGAAGLASLTKTTVKTGIAAGKIVRSMNNRQSQAAVSVNDVLAPTRANASPDMQRWHTLVELDPDIAAVAARAREAGAEYEAMLAQKYLVLNDKQYLGAALAKVLEQAQQDAERRSRDELIPARGSVGNSMYKRNPDGTYIIVQGRGVGKVYGSFEDMRAAHS